MSAGRLASWQTAVPLDERPLSGSPVTPTTTGRHDMTDEHPETDDEQRKEQATEALLQLWSGIYGERAVEQILAHYGGKQQFETRLRDLQRRVMTRRAMRRAVRKGNGRDRRLTLALLLHLATIRLFIEVFGPDEGARIHNTDHERQYAAGAEPAW